MRIQIDLKEDRSYMKGAEFYDPAGIVIYRADVAVIRFTAAGVTISKVYPSNDRTRENVAVNPKEIAADFLAALENKK